MMFRNDIVHTLTDSSIIGVPYEERYNADWYINQIAKILDLASRNGLKVTISQTDAHPDKYGITVENTVYTLDKGGYDGNLFGCSSIRVCDHIEDYSERAVSRHA